MKFVKRLRTASSPESERFRQELASGAESVTPVRFGRDQGIRKSRSGGPD